MNKIDQDTFNTELKEKASSMVTHLRYLHPDKNTLGIIYHNPRTSNTGLWVGDFSNKRNRNVTGVFEDQASLLKSVLNLDDAVYPERTLVSLNGIDPSEKTQIKERLFANDLVLRPAEVPTLSNLFVEISPVRPVDLSVTEEEKNHAKELADTIIQDTVTHGWPEPLLGDTANGIGLFYKIDLPNDPESIDLLEKGFVAAFEGYSNENAHVLVTFLPTSMVPLLGTWVRVGEDLPNRPHRKSTVISTPAEPKPISEELLRSLLMTKAAPEEELDPQTQEEPTEIISAPAVTGNTISGADILRMDVPVKSSIIVDKMIVKREITSIGSLQEYGKSVLALNLALAIGSPLTENIFGLNIITHGNCLFVNSQSLIHDIKQRISLMSRNNLAFQAGLGAIHYLSLEQNEIRLIGKNLNDESFIDTVTQSILSTDSICVFLDAFTDFVIGADPANLSKYFTRLKRIADKTDCAVVLVHKGDLNAVSTTGAAISNYVDNAFNIQLSKNNNGLLMLKCDKSRNFEKPTSIDIKMTENLTFEGNSFIDVSLPKRGPKQKIDTGLVVETLKEMGGAVNKQQVLVDRIIRDTGLSQSAIRNCIADAVELGLINEIAGLNSGREKSYQLS